MKKLEQNGCSDIPVAKKVNGRCKTEKEGEKQGKTNRKQEATGVKEKGPRDGGCKAKEGGIGRK